MSRYAQHVSTRQTPQTSPIPGREAEMVPNSAGGYVFPVDKWTRLHRFILLGNSDGTYYATERALTLENAACVRECLAEDAARTIGTIVAISDSGRAPKNDPAIFALALAAGGGHAALARDALPKVCRTGTHVLQFVDAVKALRGFGPSLRALVGNWYAGQPAEDLAFQVTKYVQRGGWSHRDVLRRTGPPAPTPAHEAIYRWIAKGMDGMGPRAVLRQRGGQPREYPGHDPELLPRIIHAYEATKKATTKDEIIRLIRDERIPREFLEGSHSRFLNELEVWEALLAGMPLTALVRNLGKMSSVGLLKPLSEAARTVCQRLGDAEYIRKSRLHPIAILFAIKTYASGHGVKGALSWTPVSPVNDALDAAFYLAFGNVEPANKRTLMGLDVSHSMSAPIGGTILSCAEAAAAMAMVQMKTEPAYQLMAFDTGMRPLDIARYSRLADVLRNTENINGGGTNCALPMVLALQNRWEVDTFQIVTDNETHSGDRHAAQALRAYREKTGIPAKAVVVGMTSSGFTVADPKDGGMLDVCGYDTSVPNVITSFSRGS
jgi:60 kDa SS-A/Ro ribonucleoprotein